MTTPRKQAAARARKATATRRKRTDPLVRAEQQRQITAGMVAGYTVDQICAATGLGRTTVWKERKRLIAAAVAERDTNTQQSVEAELGRLDALQAAHWQAATVGPVIERENADGSITTVHGTPDEKSAGVVLRCIAQRCKILGLDAPVKVDVTQRSQLDAQIEELVDELENKGIVKQPSKGRKP